MDEEYKEDPDIKILLEQYDHIKVPRNWEYYSKEKKLDFIAERILIVARKAKTTKYSEMKEEGWLSTSQLARRRRREVYSKLGDLDAAPWKRGSFRPYAKDRLEIKREDE